jgi:hypothetical protein
MNWVRARLERCPWVAFEPERNLPAIRFGGSRQHCKHPRRSHPTDDLASKLAQPTLNGVIDDGLKPSALLRGVFHVLLDVAHQ